MPKSRGGKPRTEQPRQTANGEANSEGKGEVQDQWAKHSTGRPPTQVLTDQAQPWSQWFPGDNGRWFYQGRLKADGSGWEYQFTEGYPPTTRRPVRNIPYDSGAPRTTDTYGTSDADPLATAEQDQLASADLTAEDKVDDISQADAIAPKPSSSVLTQEHHNEPESQLQLVTLSTIPP